MLWQLFNVINDKQKTEVGGIDFVSAREKEARILS